MITNIMQIQSLTIGKRGETGAEVLTFDLSEFITRWGAGTATLLHKRPNDLRPYLVSGVVQSNTANTLTWTVSGADTAQAGTGELEIRWTITNGTAKSAKFKTVIVDALVDETAEHPGSVVYMFDKSGAHTSDSTADLTDMNNLTTPGWYVIGYSRSVDNCPIASGVVRYAFVTTYGTSSGQMRMQFVYGANGTAYLREYRNSAWSAWKKINDVNVPVLPATDNTVLEATRTAVESSVANVGTKIKVLSYNVAHYDNDTPDSSKVYINDSQLAALKQLIGSVDADFIGTQEDAVTINGTDQNTMNYVFRPQYAVKIGEGGSCLYSKKAFGSGNVGTETLTSGRAVKWGKMAIGDTNLLFCNLHAIPDSGSTSKVADRLVDYTEALTFANTYAASNNCRWVIFTGDFNSKEDADRENLKTVCAEKGYTMANGGRFGWLKTHKNDRALDNILVNGNCIINGVTAHESMYASLYSDHIPLSASITLLD